MKRPFHFGERVLIGGNVCAAPFDFTGDREVPPDGFSRPQKRVAVDYTRIDRRGGRRTAKGQPALHMIQPLIPQRYTVLGCDGLQPSPSPGPRLPTDFEEVREIRIHRKRQPDRQGKEAIVVDSKPLETETLPNESSAREM
jgi:hypothetical protein